MLAIIITFVYNKNQLKHPSKIPVGVSFLKTFAFPKQCVLGGQMGQESAC